MITKFLKDTTIKYFTKYLNLPPKQKALADIVGYFALILFVGIVVGLVAHFGLWIEFFILWMVYFVAGMVRLLYTTRVQWYELQEKYKK